MGEMAELFAEGWFDEDENDLINRLEENLSKSQWETKEGQLIKFRNMETSHIKNCIAYIQRNRLHIEYATFADYIDAFNSELERRSHDEQRLRKILTTNS